MYSSASVGKKELYHKIITLFKNKGERSDYNNYRGISLLSVIGKVSAKAILIRLQKVAERVYPGS